MPFFLGIYIGRKAKMLIEMKVDSITIDPFYQSPIIILKDISNNYSLPIWVGTFEAHAIAVGINGNGILRPLPYDIMKELLQRLNLKLEKIIVNDLKDNTFYAIIELNKNGEKITIDSRPSDAIALAVRAGAPIMVHDMVIKKAKKIELDQCSNELKQKGQKPPVMDKEKLKDWLKKLKPEDFGKYEM